MLLMVVFLSSLRFIDGKSKNDSLNRKGKFQKMGTIDTSKIPNSLQEHWMPFTSIKILKKTQD